MSISDLETALAYIWLAVHLVGAGVMAWAWWRYRQTFFVWSALKWAAQSFAGGIIPIVLRDGLLRHELGSGTKAVVAVTGVLALYYTMKMIGRRRHIVSVIAETPGKLLIRDGFASYVIEVPQAAPAPNEDQIDTPKPGSRA